MDKNFYKTTVRHVNIHKRLLQVDETFRATQSTSSKWPFKFK